MLPKGDATILGPVGVYPFKYRVVIIDRSDSRKAEDWKVVVQQRSITSIDGWTVVGDLIQNLYEHGKEMVDRTTKGEKDSADSQ